MGKKIHYQTTGKGIKYLIERLKVDMDTKRFILDELTGEKKGDKDAKKT